MKKRAGILALMITLVAFSALTLTGCVMDQFGEMFADCCFSPAMILPLGFLALAFYNRYTP